MVAVWGSVAFGLLLVGAFALAGRGTFEHALVGLIVIGGLLLFVGTVRVNFLARRWRLQVRWITPIGLLASVICVTQVGSFISGLLIHKHYLMAAPLFCDQAIGRV